MAIRVGILALEALWKHKSGFEGCGKTATVTLGGLRTFAAPA
ncbi:MAG: hypothetical protein ACI9TA_002694, partial [Reinekea sp.]